MAPPFRYRLSDDEKDALLCEQAALIERQAARITELEALLARPKKTSRNSHTPPSQDRKPGVPGDKNDGKRGKPRASRPGSARPLADAPDETIEPGGQRLPELGGRVSGQRRAAAPVKPSNSADKRR